MFISHQRALWGYRRGKAWHALLRRPIRWMMQVFILPVLRVFRDMMTTECGEVYNGL
jgi:hypothetical protein